jgi:hypothetical protein
MRVPPDINALLEAAKRQLEEVRSRHQASLGGQPVPESLGVTAKNQLENLRSAPADAGEALLLPFHLHAKEVRCTYEAQLPAPETTLSGGVAVFGTRAAIPSTGPEYALPTPAAQDIQYREASWSRTAQEARGASGRSESQETWSGCVSPSRTLAPTARTRHLG